jgi:hypothetical protein
MAISPEDRATIVELISLHGHLFDDDTVVDGGAGWRISHRRVVPRRVPLNGRRT